MAEKINNKPLTFVAGKDIPTIQGQIDYAAVEKLTKQANKNGVPTEDFIKAIRKVTDEMVSKQNANGCQCEDCKCNK